MNFQTQECTAIITGASSGLGAEFARQLAPQARALVLVARRQDALEEVKRELHALKPGLQVELIVADVATEQGRASLARYIGASELKPNLLINNAGLGDYGTLLSAPLERLKAQVDVNVGAVVYLTHSLVPLLKRSAAAPAGVINISSLASMLPMPDFAVYAASKAFVTSFSEAVAVELQHEHVVVTCVCPGPTPTNFGKTARRADGADTDRSGQGLLRIPASQVVAEGLAALRRGRACILPGAGVSIAGPLFRIMPRFLMRWVLRRRFNKGRI